MQLNNEHIAIMRHTQSAPHRVYCGDSSEMQELVKAGLMREAGRKSFVPDPYFSLTPDGILALNS